MMRSTGVGHVPRVLALLLAGFATVEAQQRPLTTEDPETVGSGRVLIEGGVELARDQLFPASGLRGDTLRAPSLGVSIGVGPTVEIQIDGGLYQRLTIVERQAGPLSGLLDIVGGRTTSLEDFVVATKVRVAAEGATRPGFGLRFGTKLPLAERKSGLGLGTTDFFATLLVGKTAGSVRTVGNVGLAILANPVASVGAATPVRAMTFGVSVARAVTTAFEVVSELDGRLAPWGTEIPSGTESRAVLRIGGRYTRGLVRLDVGIPIGLTPRDPSVGLSFGFTYVVGG